jgi:pimeloyl-ACP methyl ester carboxylesterase
MMRAESGFAEVNGTRLYYETAGDPAREPLVFVHGFTLDTRMWDDQFKPFAQHYRVIRYDARGFGRSALPESPYRHEADLKALLEHLGVERAHVVALSMGGGIAIDFALTYQQTTRSLVAVDAVVGGWHWSDEDVKRSKIRAEITANEGIPGAKRAWLAHPLFAPANEQPAVATRLARMVDDYSGWHFVNNNPALGLKPRAIERLEQIAAPTLVILGERDTADFHGMADALASRVPNVRKVVLPGVGHMANMEAPNAFNAAVFDFLRDNG